MRTSSVPLRLADQAHRLFIHLGQHPNPKAADLVDRAYARWQRRVDAQAAAAAIPVPSSELRATVKRRGYDIIECIVAGVRIGYYAFLDAGWLGPNRRGQLPVSYSAAYNALDRERAARQGVAPGRAWRNQLSQTAQYAGR